MLHEEVIKYRELSGDINPHTPISRIGGYLDGYEKALEQVPCEDAISRQAVRDTIFVECSGEKLDIDFAKVLLLQRAIKVLPSVNPQPKPCDDCISRQAVLEYIEGSEAELGHDSENELVCQDIKELPPVTPQPKTGYWIKMPIGFKCSNCNELEDRTTKYCPNCGFRMFEPQEES